MRDTCPRCLEVISQPVLLPCDHSLCSPCAEKAILLLKNNFSKKHVAREMEQFTLNSAPKVQKIVCPECEEEHNLPNGLESLKPNDALAQFVEKKCFLKCGKEATCECAKCEVRLCEECFTSEHKKSPLLVQHKPLQIKIEPAPLRTCSKHDELPTHYCKKCCKLLCSECVSSNESGDSGSECKHSLVEMAKYASFVREEMKEDVPEFTEAIKKIENEVVQLQENQKRLQSTSEALDAEIQMLLQKKKEVTQAIEIVAPFKVKKLKEQQRALQLMLEDMQKFLTMNLSQLPKERVNVVYQQAIDRHQDKTKCKQEACCSSSLEPVSSSVAKVGDVVWVLVKGYPWWPALVVDPEKEKLSSEVKKDRRTGEQLVKFFGEGTYSWVHPGDFDQVRSFLVHNYLAMQAVDVRSRRDLQKAVELANEHIKKHPGTHPLKRKREEAKAGEVEEKENLEEAKRQKTSLVPIVIN